MKHTILTLLLFASTGAMGQVVTTQKTLEGYISKEQFESLKFYSLRDSIILRSDTVPVIMLVSDTVKYDTGKRRLYWTIDKSELSIEVDTIWMADWITSHRLPEKIEDVYKTDSRVFWMRGYMIYQWNRDSYYLDRKKKRINYVVWLSQREGK